MEVLEGQNILVTISGKKNRVRVYYLSWLKSKILRTDGLSDVSIPTRTQKMSHVNHYVNNNFCFFLSFIVFSKLNDAMDGLTLATYKALSTLKSSNTKESNFSWLLSKIPLKFTHGLQNPTTNLWHSKYVIIWELFKTKKICNSINNMYSFLSAFRALESYLIDLYWLIWPWKIKLVWKWSTVPSMDSMLLI